MANPSLSLMAGSPSVSEADRRNKALDAQRRSGFSDMKIARRITPEDVPIMKHAVGKCETEQQKRNLVATLREQDGMGAYLAYCADVPGDIVEEEDPSNTQKRASWAYTGPYVKPHDYREGKRMLEKNEQGTPILVKNQQRTLFGNWTKSWRDGPSRAEEDPLLDLGPSDELAAAEVPQPWGWSFDELADMQQVVKGEYERERKRERREESEWRVVVRRLLRRVRARFSGEKVTVEKAAGGSEGSRIKVAAATPVKNKKGETDSGYSSLAKSR